MTYRTILFELRDDVASGPHLRLAFALARRFGAELVAAHIATLPAMPVGLGDSGAYVDVTMIEAQREANRIIQERVRAAFEREREADVPARALFLEDLADHALAALARTADLTLVGSPEPDGMGDLLSRPVDEILVQAGGPVLVLPAGPATLPPARALLAWDGSRQAARAMKDALPLLIEVPETVLLTLGDEVDRAAVEAAAAMLGRHGVKVRHETRAEHGPTGSQLLAVATELGAGLLVMGAYSHSRLREAVFGGTTHDVLRDGSLPILFGA